MADIIDGHGDGIDPDDEAQAWRMHWRELLLGRASFVPILLLAIIIIISAPMIDEWKFGLVLVYPFVALLVLLAFHRSGISARTIRLATAAVIGAGIFIAVTGIARQVTWGRDEFLVAVSSFLTAALMAITFPIVIRQAFNHRRVDLNTLAAGITAYLLIGLMFAGLFRATSALENYHLFAHVGFPSAGDYTYFSFITLTTVGYGDFVPGTDAARSLAIAEAIMGQIFLVTAVARIVSMMGFERSSSRAVPVRRTFDDEPD